MAKVRARMTLPDTAGERRRHRHDPATPLAIAEAASARYGWPHLIEDAADDPPMEQPEAFLNVLHAALGRL